MKYTAEQVFDLINLAIDLGLVSSHYPGSLWGALDVDNDYRWLKVSLRRDSFSRRLTLVYYATRQSGGGGTSSLFKSCEVFRPGQWVTVLEGKIVKATRKEATEIRHKRMAHMTRFDPIDDAFIFNGKGKPKSERPEQNTLEELAELIHQLIDNAVNDHM